MSLTPEELDALRRLLSEMTPGTWMDAGPVGRAIWITRGTDDIGAPDDHQIAMFYGPTTNPRGQVNATGIVALRNAAPALLTAAGDLATLRLEHESWGAIIDGLRASLATVTRERDEARELLRRLNDIERIDAHRAGYTGCKCMARSKAAEQAYEMGRCPHQLADAALAGGKS